MARDCVGLISAGEMGSAVARTLTSRGQRVVSVTSDRSPKTTERARSAGVEAVAGVEQLVSEAEVVVSIVPPGAASEVAERLASSIRSVRATPTVVDANAVSPATAAVIARTLEDAGARFVDGDIIGGPPAPDRAPTRLYLSGADAERAASLLGGAELRAVPLAGAPLGASSLKMAYAAWTKGSAALALAAWALAKTLDVEEALLTEWEESQPALRRLCETAAHGSGKAWRYVAEMNEIASTLQSAGLPEGAAQSAAAMYERLASLKGDASPSITKVLDLLVDGGE